MNLQSTPNLSAAQFLPQRTQRRLDRLISRMAHHNRSLQAALRAARQAAHADQLAQDAWVCAQAPYDHDLPW